MNLSPEMYVGLAVVILVLTVALLWRSDQVSAQKEVSEQDDDSHSWSLDASQVATRIYDPQDYYWLRDNLGMLRLARELKASRKRLALQLLADVVVEYRKLVAGFRHNPKTAIRSSVPVEINLLRQTATFYILIVLARLTILLFGPYTKLSSIFWAHQYAVSLRDMREDFVDSQA